MPEPSDDKESEEKDQQEKDQIKECYRLTNDNETFTSRVDSIFGCLNSLEEKHNDSIKGFENVHKNEEDEKEEHSCCGEEKQSNVNKRKSSTPGYETNPKKWKKYSLKDDGTSKFSGFSPDQLNSKVATDLMKKLKTEKEKNIESTDRCDKTFVFKVPDLPTDKKIVNKSIFGISHAGNARCMETFEFGQINKQRHYLNNRRKDISSEISNESSHTQTINIGYNVSKDIDDEGEKDVDESDDCKVKFQTVTSCNTGFKSSGKKKNRVIRKKVSEDNE